ncbi:MAG: SAF domain-containing protein [bacterium]
MNRRRRGLLLLGAAGVCILFTVVIALRLQQKVTAGYGPMRGSVVVIDGIEQGQLLTAETLYREIAVRRIPVVFIPPGTLHDPGEAIGARAAIDIPSGTYLQDAFLEQPGEVDGSATANSGRRPVEVSVVGAGALTLAAGEGGGISVDVVVSGQPGLGRGRTAVVARGVPLVRLAKPDSPGDGWKATVAVSGRQALRLISAESSGRVIRLLPLRMDSG